MKHTHSTYIENSQVFGHYELIKASKKQAKYL